MININIWLDIPDYPNYKIRISTNEISSLNKTLSNGILKSGHMNVGLYRDGIRKTCWIHQIVARIKYGYWCPKGLEVCHNDGDPQNNHPDNLRYSTHKENMKDRSIHGNTHFINKNPKFWLGKKGGNHIKSKPVLQFEKSGEFIKEWHSIIDIERTLQINHANISACCSGKLKTAGKFIWKYK